MKTDNTIASFWHAYAAADQATKFLSGKSEPLAPDPMANAVHADESIDSAMLEVVEHHP